MQACLPEVVHVKRRYDCPELIDPVPTRVESEIAKILKYHSVPKGSKVGICAGSRGIFILREITRSVVDCVRAHGCEPVILPAMGSHGGATAEGQEEMLADPAVGITEVTMSCSIDSRMETVVVNESCGYSRHPSSRGCPCFEDRS